MAERAQLDALRVLLEDLRAALPSESVALHERIRLGLGGLESLQRACRARSDHGNDYEQPSPRARDDICGCEAAEARSMPASDAGSGLPPSSSTVARDLQRIGTSAAAGGGGGVGVGAGIEPPYSATGDDASGDVATTATSAAIVAEASAADAEADAASRAAEALALKEQAAAMFSARDFGRALSLCDGCVALEPGQATHYANRSLAKLRLGDPSGAAADARAAVRLRPGWGRAHYRLGCALLGAGDFGGALDALEASLARDPGRYIMNFALLAVVVVVAAAAAAAAALVVALEGAAVGNSQACLVLLATP